MANKWHYESDGESSERTHYAWRENETAPCGIERKDFRTKEDAKLFVSTENAFMGFLPESGPLPVDALSLSILIKSFEAMSKGEHSIRTRQLWAACLMALEKAKSQ